MSLTQYYARLSQRCLQEKLQRSTHLLADNEIVTCVVDVVVQLNKLRDGDIPLAGEAVTGRLCSGNVVSTIRRKRYARIQISE